MRPLIPLLALLAVCAGCFVSYHRLTLESQLVREDGSITKVRCVSTLPHQIKSISPKLGDRPHVVIILDELTFEVDADEVRLNSERYAELPGKVDEVLIRLDGVGTHLTADGVSLEPVGAAAP